jgi:hypothetical protein
MERTIERVNERMRETIVVDGERKRKKSNENLIIYCCVNIAQFRASGVSVVICCEIMRL